LEAYLTELGLEVWEDDAGVKIGGSCNNLLARVAANKEGVPGVFFSAHMDTVETTAGLKIIEREGTLYSDGTTILGADDKAGLAPIIEAVRSVMEDQKPHGDIYLLFSVAEEVGLKGAAAMDMSRVNADFGYVLDTGPPVGTFVNRTAYHDCINYKIIGKPAHAGKHPEDGINAIKVAAEAIAPMRVGRIGPETTNNIGMISGGSAVNVVCPSVELKCEARSTSLEDLDELIRHMDECVEQACTKYGAKLEREYERHYDAYHIDEVEEVVQVAQEAARKLGFSGNLRTTLGGSDANAFNAKGKKSIVVGTGMKDIHTHDEHVSIVDLVDAARLVEEIIGVISAKTEN
jgi:tripeptide aminopeptidase